MDEFSTLYKKYAPDVFRFALYLSGDHSQAEDITSETFVRVWTSPGRVHMAFLHGIRGKARHVALDTELPDPQANPYDRTERREELRAVLGGLQELPEIERASLLMRALGISLSSVKVKIRRARLALAGLRQE
jgi:DNA-directed RNA polymerase specialized sigma24 family protein